MKRRSEPENVLKLAAKLYILLIRSVYAFIRTLSRCENFILMFELHDVHRTKGEQFTTTEATDFFFAMTKLFQNNDITLRRMCYLTIKELSKMTEHAFIMTQSLSKVIFQPPR